MIPGEQPPKAHPVPELRPPGTNPGPVTGKTVKHGLFWAALTIAIILGLIVVLVLPKLVAETTESLLAGSSGQATASAIESANARNNAEQALQDFLFARARLELANAPAWGEPQWSQAVEGADRGIQLFGQHQFLMATKILTEALDLLLMLENEREPRLEHALDSGWAALQTDDDVTATTFFETAVSIDAGNENALEGLQRAQVRPDLLDLMASGESALSMGELHSAQEAYLDAVELDGAYEPAARALQDVNEQLKEIAFGNAMSQALGALDAGQINEAETALRQAAKLKPGETVVRDTREQLVQKRQQLWMAEQRRKASISEHDEDWPAAVAIYRKVLANSPQAAFATNGLAFAQDRARLHRQIDHYLADPSRVYSDQPRANAEQLLESAGSPPAAEIKLSEKIRLLQALIIEAQTPQTVTLQSDGLTHVQIYHIGQLGRFTHQQLELRPGTYTVVGSRPGYRDVRQTFTVKPGPDQPTLDIRCEEPV